MSKEELERVAKDIDAKSEPEAVGPQFDDPRAVIEEELASWLMPAGEQIPIDAAAIAGFIAWEVEAAFPVGPMRTREEIRQVVERRRLESDRSH